MFDSFLQRFESRWKCTNETPPQDDVPGSYLRQCHRMGTRRVVAISYEGQVITSTYSGFFSIGFVEADTAPYDLLVIPEGGTESALWFK